MSRTSFLPVLVLSIAAVAGCATEDPTERPLQQLGSGSPGGFRDVVQQVLPSIVFIQTEATPPPGLERLLPGIQQIPNQPIPTGMGSGVLFTSDGYILTNNHVVQAAERVRVVLHDRRHFEAQVVGRDPSTDVAVVRITGEGFPAAELGDSDDLEIGDWVLALGSPLGLQFSVTAGVVSGIGRAIGILSAQARAQGDQIATLEHFIQTDAALSPGNSGGPLINTAGQVIGINTAVAAPPGVPASVGFAIPSNLARYTAEQLVRFGEVRRAYLGVGLMNVTPMMAAAEGLERVEGAAILQVEPGGPAAVAGLLPGDVVLEIAGQPVRTVSDLQNQLVRLEPGSSVRLRAIRDAQEITLSAQLGLARGGTGAPR